MISNSKRNYQKLMPHLEGSIMPQAKFLQDLYYLALARYQLASQYAQAKIILDAGCGAGYGSHLLAQSDAKKVYGVDISSESIRYCQSQYQHQNLIFQPGDLSRLDFPAGFFDLVIAFEVIEHINDYYRAIDEFYRVLKPGGMLIISTPNKAVYSPDTAKPFYPFHYHEFYLKDLKEMLARFEIKSIQGQYIKGKKMLIYGRLNPKRILRIIYANLPFFMKITATRLYLKIFSYLDAKKIYQPQKIKLSDVYYSDNLAETRVLVAVCQKPPKD